MRPRSKPKKHLREIPQRLVREETIEQLWVSVAAAVMWAPQSQAMREALYPLSRDLIWSPSALGQLRRG